MRIAIATAVYYPQVNGVAVFSHNLARGLVARGHEVLVIAPSLDGKSHVGVEDGVRVARLRSVEVKFYPDQVHQVKRRLLYRHGFRVSVFPQREVARILEEFGPEVVHVQVSDPIGLSVVGWARAHAVPVVTTEHNQPEVLTDPLRMPRILKKPANALLAAYFVNRQSKSDFVTMPTEKAIRVLLGSGKDFAVPVAAVSNGVDLARFRPRGDGATKSVTELDGSDGLDELRSRYKLYKDCPTVLYVGRLDPEKNVGLVIEAFRIACAKLGAGQKTGVDSRRPAAQMLIVGDGVDRQRLEAMAAGMPNIHFAGRVVGDDLYKVYRLGDVFATASEIETQGIVLIEAAACGLPLVAVDAGAVSEICVDNENGFLCRPGDIAGVAEALVRILSDSGLQERFAQKSLELAREHDLEKTLDQFENIYQRVTKLYKE